MHVIKRIANFACIFATVVAFSSFACIVKCDHDGKSNSTLPDQPPLKVKLTTEDAWIRKSLLQHNYYRNLHNVQPLKLNKTLSEMSQSWSNYLLFRGLSSIINGSGDVDFFDHNYFVLNGHNVGQNLYYMSACYEKLTPGLPVSLWYNEIKDYNFPAGGGTNGESSLTGHFSQLIWNSSVQMGAAYASRKLPNNQTLTFVTAYYYPRGNMFLDENNPVQLFLDNVPPLADNYSSVERKIQDLIDKHGLLQGNVSTPSPWTAAAIAKHNDYRGEYGLPEILISDALCQTAQAWADLLLKNGVDEFNRNQMILPRKNAKSIFGENMMYFISHTEDIDASIPLFLWYDEKKWYDWAKRGTDVAKSKTAKTHQFEQILWKSTTHMCMVIASGVAENGQYLTFTVAQYYPSGQGKAINLEEKVANIPLERKASEKKA